MSTLETSTFEAVTTDGRRVRIERDTPAFDAASDRILKRFEPRLYIDGEVTDPTGLAVFRDLGGRLVIHSSVGELVIAR